MIRTTTPTHIYTFEEDISGFAEIELTYKQRDVSLVKKREDLVCDAHSVSYHFTQAETRLFSSTVDVYSQLRFLTDEGDVLATDVFTIPVEAILNDEVLEA